MKTQAVSDAVARLYDTYPFPPEPFLDQAPPWGKAPVQKLWTVGQYQRQL